jgi:hypothetical protein
MPRHDAKDEGHAVWNLPNSSEPGCTESSELARLARLESKSEAMADDVLATWDATKRSEHGSLRRRRWVGRAWGVAVFAAAALIGATLAAIARAPADDARERQADQLAAPRQWGPFRP